MADVFDIDIGGEGVQNDAQSDEDDDQDSFQRWVWMRFMFSGIFCYSNDFFLLARQMTMMNPTQSM